VQFATIVCLYVCYYVLTCSVCAYLSLVWRVSLVLIRVSQNQSQSHVATEVSQSVCFGVEPRLGFMTRYSLFERYCPVHVGRPLWQEDGSVITVTVSSISQLSICTVIYVLLLNKYTGPLSFQAYYSRLCPISSRFRYNGSLAIWTVVCLTAAKFKPLLFSMSVFALSNIENNFIIMVLYDFCLLP
jgi:hypothetical protein